MKRILSAALLLCLAMPAQAAKLTIPGEVKAPAGDWYVLQPETDCKGITFIGLDDLKPLPSAVVKDPRWMVVSVPASGGRWRFTAVGTLDDQQVRVDFVVTSGDAPPGPGPTPPGPTPPVPPVPPGPVAGMRVLVLYESADLSKLTAGQNAVMFGKTVRDALDARTPLGPDKKTHTWRMWDADTDPKGDEPVWADVLKRKPAKDKLPWVIITDAAGKPAFEGPLPGTVDEMVALLKKWGN